MADSKYFPDLHDKPGPLHVNYDATVPAPPPAAAAGGREENIGKIFHVNHSM